MTGSVRASVLVHVAPAEAFRLFTEELNAWYRVDEFTVADASKTVALRIEPRVGGRFVDVHDAATGEGPVLGEVQVWDPPQRFQFVDSHGSEVEVTFSHRGDATRVSIEQRGIDRLPPDVADHVQRFGWHTIVSWFGDHAGSATHPPGSGTGALVPYLFYDDAGAMMDWYERVFGFVEISRWCGTDGRVHNGEMSTGSSELWLDGGGPRQFDKDGKRATPWTGVLVDDVDAMYDRVRAAGVEADPPVDQQYGVRMLAVTDPEGYSWGFIRRKRG